MEGRKHKNSEPWYMLDVKGDICRMWDLFVAVMLGYSHIVVPFM